MSDYKLAIFDFDGTLANSFPWFCTVINQIADKFAFRRVEESEIEGMRDLTNRQIMAALGVPAWKLPGIAISFRKLVAESAGSIPLFPGAADMLERLHAGGLRIAIVSSNAEATIRKILGAHADLVEHYGCGSSMWGKAEKFKTALQALGLPASQAIAIGDEVRDIEAARQAGIAAGSVTFGYNSAKVLVAQRPDHLFSNYSEVTAKLLA
ncbi:MAG: HAD-IA family hydrolase [Devosia sp.]